MQVDCRSEFEEKTSGSDQSLRKGERMLAGREREEGGAKWVMTDLLPLYAPTCLK